MAHSSVRADVGSLEFLEAWRALVNGDADLRHRGRYVRASFRLGFGEREYLVDVVDGEIAPLRRFPLLLPRWDFSLRAPVEAWRTYLEPCPPPYFQDLFAMTKRGHLVIEGNVTLLLQNVRALKAYLAAMRRLGG